MFQFGKPDDPILAKKPYVMKFGLFFIIQGDLLSYLILSYHAKNALNLLWNFFYHRFSL
jgi:hypothetical protein